MGKIVDLHSYNNNRQDLLKVKTVSDGIVLFTKEEAKEVLIKYIIEELDIFSDGITKEVKNELDNKIAQKLASIEKSMFQHIENKINKATEKIFEAIIDRKIEAEVTKRVDERLTKIKNSI